MPRPPARPPATAMSQHSSKMDGLYEYLVVTNNKTMANSSKMDERYTVTNNKPILSSSKMDER